MKRISRLVVLMGLSALTASADIHYVNIKNLSPLAPYTNWATAATNIQVAINAATSYDTVLVTNGVYDSGGRAVYSNMTNRVAITKPIAVRSVNGPEVTIIKGRGSIGNSAVRCVYMTNNAVLAGFTLTNGFTRTSGDQVKEQSGGGVWCESTSAVLSNCVLTGNKASQYGGGVYYGSLYNCSVIGNIVSNQGGGAYGGALYNCMLTGNVAAQGGGVVNGNLYNCTLADNSASVMCGGALGGILHNCIAYYNADANYAYCLMNNCCTLPLPDSGVSNITIEPGFVNREGGNYRLMSGSACVDAGDNAYAVGDTDLDGNPRILGRIVDMGCYEASRIDIEPSAVHYVSPSGRNIWPFTNWIDAATIIQNAVDTAAAGDTVLVTNGVYDSGGVAVYSNMANRVAITKPITVRSVNGTEATVIKGQGPIGNSAVRCVYMTNGAVLAGFTLTNGATRTNYEYFASANGGGVYCESTNAVVSNCLITGNRASRAGGGAFNGTLRHCKMIGNQSDDSGGGIYLATVENSLICSNRSANFGGGADDCNLYQCTITGNAATNYAGGLYNCRVWNSIVYNNAALSGSNYTSSSFQHSCATPNPGGAGNVADNPEFMNPQAGDYHLSYGSPCIDVGDNAYVMGDTDLDGSSRILGRFVDMGCYETSSVEVGLLYDLGEIPVQTVQTGRVITFAVYAPELSRQADFTCFTTGGFKGLLSFDSRTHVFSYTPSPNDQQPFYITFTATAGATQSTQTVEFRPVVEPPVVEPPPTYLIGEIPPQTAWIGTNRTFYVAVTNWGAGVAYSCAVTPQPAGSLTLDAGSGLFSFAPAAVDKGIFLCVFSAAQGTNLVSQTVQIQAMEHLPPETEVFGLTPTHGLPDEDDNDYILRNEVFCDAPESFNWQWRTNRIITLAGKKLVFQEGHANGLYAYNDNADIKAMNIYAETVVIRSPLRLPQTAVMIYAKELRFEDQVGSDSAQIITTPLTNPMNPEPTINGLPGLKAGEIILNVGIFSNSGSTARFVLEGGQGQTAGEGIDGASGSVVATCGNWHGCPWPTNTIAARYVDSSGWGTMYYYFNFDDYNLPTDGYPATPGARPGDGGEGNNLYCNIGGLASCVIDGGGLAGEKAAVAKGGKAGTPNPAYRAAGAGIFGMPYDWWILNTWTFHDGADAPAPDANVPVGSDGQCYQIGHSLSWLSPYALKMILAHAKDAYLYGYLDFTDQICKEYIEYLDLYASASNEWDRLPWRWQTEFNQMKGEMVNIRHRIASHLDYFGNPAGWVPMLSFEVTKAMFEQETDQAIRTLYLTYWIGHAVTNIQSRLGAMTSARDQLLTEAENCVAQHNDAMEKMPALVTQSINMSNRLSGLEVQRNQLEQKFEALAESNVKARHEVPFWKKVVKSICSVVSALPVFQPATGLIAGGLNLSVDYDSNNPNGIQKAFDGAVALANQTKSFENQAKAFSAEWAGFTNAWNLKTNAPVAPPSLPAYNIGSIPAQRTEGNEVNTFIVKASRLGGDINYSASASSTIMGSMSLNSESGQFTYTPAADFSSENGFTITFKAISGGFTEKQTVWFTPSYSTYSPAAFSPQIIQQTKQSASADAAGPDISSALTHLGNIANQFKPCVENVINIFKETEAPAPEVAQELAKLKAESPEFNELMADIYNLQKEQVAVAQLFNQLSELAMNSQSTMNQDLLAADGLNRSVAQYASALDQRAVMYLKGMEHRAKERLLKYHYYMAKAYEYRMLRPYPGELNLNSLFAKFLTILQTGSSYELRPEDFDALKTLYEEQISSIAEGIYDEYNANRPELSAPIWFTLSSNELQRLNTGEAVTINLQKMGIFPSDEENIRIVDFKVKSLTTHIVGNLGDSALMDLWLKHSGISTLRKDGHDYLFRHYNSGTENPIVWGARYDPIDNVTTQMAPSAASASLLYSLLDSEGIPTTSDNLLLYSRPAAWADIVLTKDVYTQGGADIVVDSLRFEVVYDFIQRGSSKAELTVQTSNGELLPYIVLGQEDRNGRQDGQGVFYRSFTQGNNVRLTAPVWYGPWKFDQWVVNTSQQAVKAALDGALSGNPPVAAQKMGSSSTNPVLDIALSGDRVVTAQYHYESEPDFDKDGMPDWWEEVYLGSTLFNGDEDDDSDGLSNYQEYLQGTNPKQQDTDSDGFNDRAEVIAGTCPTNSASSLRPAGSMRNVQDLTQLIIQWPSVSNRTYTLWRNTNLLTGFSILNTNIPAYPPINIYTDPVRTIDLNQRFYRIQVEDKGSH
jgi:hypothetical protein